jgi:phage terminase large subunit-like protein
MPIQTFEDNRSWIDRWRDEGTLRDKILALPDERTHHFPYLWQVWSRPNQQVPAGMGDQYRIWMFRAGRGSGKTRAGAETVRLMVEAGCRRIALVAPTAADVRDVMIEGESGLLSVFPDEDRPTYQPSLRRVTFKNGAIAVSYSADEPERLRGPQHDFAWIDEPASMPRGEETFSNLMLGLRLGNAPWAMVTGTPKPLRWLRELSEQPQTLTTVGSTFDNERHLASTFITDVLGRYEGTRLGRQELYAEWLDDVEGALWTERTIDQHRIANFDLNQPWQSLNIWLEAGGHKPFADRRLWRTIVAVDPPGETAECGIVVATAPTQGRAGIDHAVILEDASMAGRPEEWGRQVVQTLKKWKAERIVVESNQGGDMVRATIHAVDPNVQINKVTARQSKTARAEPVSALYERGLVHHFGFHPLLESQMTSWTKDDGKSPDRMDALVHAINYLLTAQAQVRSLVMSPTARRIA